MVKTSTGYYHDELTHWSDTLDFYLREIPEFEARLIELVRRNTIINLAVNAEHFLYQFKGQRERLQSLQKEIQQQEMKFSKLDDPGDHSPVVQQTMTSQSMLRTKMQAIEKDFIDAEYGCYHFLASVFKN